MYEKRRAVFVVPLGAFLQKAVPPSAVDDYVQKISIGDMLDRDLLTAKLEAGGYHRVAIVEEEGNTVSGGIP